MKINLKKSHRKQSKKINRNQERKHMIISNQSGGTTFEEKEFLKVKGKERGKEKSFKKMKDRSF